MDFLVRIKRDNDVVLEAEIEKVQRQQTRSKRRFFGWVEYGVVLA